MPAIGDLSPRELEVLELVAAGLTNEAISQRLFLSVRTVEHHLSNIYAKLGLSGKAARAAAAVSFIQLELNRRAARERAACRPPGPRGWVLSPMTTPWAVPSDRGSVRMSSLSNRRRRCDMARDLMLEQAQVTAVEPVREYDIRGGGGITLHAREWGNPDGPPILFVHGWSQCDLCWSGQVGSELAASFRMVTFDNRGHGMSEKPLDPGCYADERLWADDLAAVIDQTGLERPVLVAWSYGGLIVTDYVRAHGDAAIAGINLVGAAVALRPPTFDHIGPGMLDNAPEACVPDLLDEHRRHPALPALAAPLGLSTTSSGAGAVLEHGRAAPGPRRADRPRDRR